MVYRKQSHGSMTEALTWRDCSDFRYDCVIDSYKMHFAFVVVSMYTDYLYVYFPPYLWWCT